MLHADVVKMVVQVNGKMRGSISVPADSDDDSVLAAALAEPNVQRHIGDAIIRKTIVVPNKLVSVVV